jgi:hypothetical protein
MTAGTISYQGAQVGHYWKHTSPEIKKTTLKHLKGQGERFPKLRQAPHPKTSFFFPSPFSYAAVPSRELD